MSNNQLDIAIIGAGVIGLAIADRLASLNLDVAVIEKEKKFGTGISSRNSEIIHAGIYYPPDSLKAKLCLRGQELLYDLGRSGLVKTKPIEKLIVATTAKEIAEIEKLYAQGVENGVEQLSLIEAKDIQRLEPNVSALAALYSPKTGIIDSFQLMDYLERKAKSNGVMFAYGNEVVAIDISENGFSVKTLDKDKGKEEITARIVVNCAGLGAHHILSILGIDLSSYNCSIRYCKGDYFSVAGQSKSLVSRLIYPAPRQDGSGLGIHTTIDFGGQMRLGPDSEYVSDTSSFVVSLKKADIFYDEVKRFLPKLRREDLRPGFSGIRSQIEFSDKKRDFLISTENNSSPFFGLVNLLGIESPGLTSSLAIAEEVERQLVNVGIL